MSANHAFNYFAGKLNPDGDVKLIGGGYVLGRSALALGGLGLKYLVTGEVSYGDVQWTLVLGAPAAVGELAGMCGLSYAVDETREFFRKSR